MKPHLSSMCFSAALAFACCFVCAPVASRAQEDEMRALYFGNSYLENSMPWFHSRLAESAGARMSLRYAIGPGWQIWMHLDSFGKSRGWARKELTSGNYNALVIQHFAAPGLTNVVDHMFDGPGRVEFDPPQDVGDIASASTLIELFLEKAPATSHVFIYSSWPGIPGAGDLRKRVRDEMMKSLMGEGESREETLKKVRERKPTLEEMRPLMEDFNYAEQWLGEFKWNAEHPWQSENAHSRDYCVQLMDGLKRRHPRLWDQGRLSLIPCGEVFYALDKKMRAGEVPGITNIGFFSRDGGHVRAGLPRYVLGATCFAVMFRRHPRECDWAVYNDLSNYETEKLKQYDMLAYCHQPDLGELLEITPERAAVVDETIWEVVTKHPYTNLRADAAKAASGVDR